MVEKGSIIVDVIPRRLGPWGWPNAAGISGRMSLERVAECRRNQWPNAVGISGRMGLEYALITEKFIWAESLRQESRVSWETHFRKVEDRLDRAFNLMDSMDRRVTTIEICLRRAPCGQILDSDIPVEQCHSALESLSEVPLKFRRRREDP
jgi:hypothetical protein